MMKRFFLPVPFFEKEDFNYDFKNLNMEI